jgi:hypothetical protein
MPEQDFNHALQGQTKRSMQNKVLEGKNKNTFLISTVDIKVCVTGIRTV